MDIIGLEKRLRVRRKELLGDLGEIEQALEAPQPTSWEDRASERQGDEVLEAIGLVDQKELRKINGALARIADGTYGMCLACGGEIAPKRLEAVPEAALCRNCA